MGQKSAQYMKSLAQSMSQADTDVMRCQQFLIGIEGSRENMEKALAVIHRKVSPYPTKTFAELSKTDAELKKAGATYERAEKELDDYKVKFGKTVREAAISIGQAQVVITNFQGYCGEKAKTWNPLKKKSLGKSLAALQKGNTDLDNLRKFLTGMVEMQKAKGNVG